MAPKNIAFIGVRGAGKSKIARKFSKSISWPLLNIDQLISYECEGRAIADIVLDLGWRGFRDMEYAVLRKVCTMNGVVIDCGGGILVEAAIPEGAGELFSDRKYDLLTKNAALVYIKRDWEWMTLKSGLDVNRPDLGGNYQKLLERRLPWYESSADYILDMQGKQSILIAVEELTAKFFPKSDNVNAEAANNGY